MDGFDEITTYIEGDKYIITFGIDEYGEIVEVFKHVDTDVDYDPIY